MFVAYVPRSLSLEPCFGSQDDHIRKKGWFGVQYRIKSHVNHRRFPVARALTLLPGSCACGTSTTAKQSACAALPHFVDVPFDTSHKLHGSHVQRLSTEPKVPMCIGFCVSTCQPNPPCLNMSPDTHNAVDAILSMV